MASEIRLDTRRLVYYQMRLVSGNIVNDATEVDVMISCSLSA